MIIKKTQMEVKQTRENSRFFLEGLNELKQIIKEDVRNSKKNIL